MVRKSSGEIPGHSDVGISKHLRGSRIGSPAKQDVDIFDFL